MGGIFRPLAAIFTGGLSEVGYAVAGALEKPSIPTPPPVPQTLTETNIESEQQKAERDLRRKKVAAAQRAQTTFTSSLGIPERPSGTIKTALGGFNDGR